MMARIDCDLLALGRDLAQRQFWLGIAIWDSRLIDMPLDMRQAARVLVGYADEMTRLRRLDPCKSLMNP